MTSLPRRFMRWWGRELVSLLPGVGKGGMPGGAWMVLSVERDGVRIFEQRGRRIRPIVGETVTPDAAIIAEVIAKHRASHRFCIRFAPSLCFLRSVELPSSAAADAEKILDLQLARGLPFAPETVREAHFPEIDGERAGFTTFRQVIVKRALIDEATSRLAEHGVTPRRIDCWDDTAAAELPVDFLSPQGTRPARGGRPLMTVLAATLLLVTGAAALTTIQHQAALDELQEKTAAARKTALSVAERHRAASAAYARLAAVASLMRDGVAILDVLAELTRLLPDTDYLVDLQVEDRTLDMSGYSHAAAALIPLLERSAIFAGAELTSPTTFDTRVGKERFSLRVRIRDPREATGSKGEAQLPKRAG